MKSLKITAILIPLLALVACSTPSSNVKSTWVAPEIGSIKFSKVMVIAATPDGALRRNAEDAITKVIPSAVVAIASYTTLDDPESLKNPEAVIKAANETDVDGIIVMRPLGKDTNIEYNRGGGYPEPYWSFGGYYRPAWGLSAYYDTGYIETETVVGVETNIYDAKSGELIWSGTAKIRNPDNVKELIDKNAESILAKLREQELIGG